mgnify:CR=1 FL=1
MNSINIQFIRGAEWAMKRIERKVMPNPTLYYALCQNRTIMRRKLEKQKAKLKSKKG